MYNIDWVKETFGNEGRVKYLFFWGHTQHKDGLITSSCLSQWWICDFERPTDWVKIEEVNSIIEKFSIEE